MNATYSMGNTTYMENPLYPYTMENVGNNQSVPLAALSCLGFVSMFSVWCSVKIPKTKCGTPNNSVGKFVRSMNYKYTTWQRGDWIKAKFRRLIFVFCICPIVISVWATCLVKPWGWKALIITAGCILSIDGFTKYEALCYFFCLLKQKPE